MKITPYPLWPVMDYWFYEAFRLGVTPSAEVALTIWLARQTQGPIMEIGVHRGLVLRILAEHNPDRPCFGVDSGKPGALEQSAEALGEEEIGQLAAHLHNVTLLKVDSTTLKLDGRFGFIRIDGDHRFEGVKADSEFAFSHILPGGLISWHDYAESGFEWMGVKRYLDTIEGVELVAGTSTAIFWQPLDKSPAL